ncbi:retinol dehydrogenase 11-like [Achroia grisella]|uniref:retinol dehydrogenase 11-like n=1 Tax=Achroia grisella TaxID=688607 RepID=UPI0027D2A9BA|nr:retinol dehydrogenase 11-like [Achroia grisella]
MDCISGWCRSQRRLVGMTAIITGCNSGIGRETAADLYSRGARVIMACRDTNKAEVAKTDIENEIDKTEIRGDLIVEKLDVSSLKSVRDFVSKILETEPQIHILINNAGVMMCPESKTEDGFETHIGTNHFGHALLTLLLLPRMIKSAPSRIVFVSSKLHTSHKVDLDDLNFEKSEYNANVAYCRSKGANVLFAKALAIKLKEHNIKDVTTYSLHPGVIKTDISRHFDKTVARGATWAFNNAGMFLKSPKCGAQTSIYCAVDEACNEDSGLYYSDCAVKRPSKQCQDDDFAIQFWEKTIESLNLNNYNAFGDSDAPKSLLA